MEYMINKLETVISHSFQTINNLSKKIHKAGVLKHTTKLYLFINKPLY